MSDVKSHDGGFTIIELMVSMAILALISIYLTGMLTQQNRAYTVVDQVTEAQSNTRAISQILEREVRASGGLAPEGAAVCGVDNTDEPDVLYVTDMDPLQITPEMNYALGGEIESGFTGGGTDTIRLIAPGGVVLDGRAFYDLDGDGTGDADFRPGAGVIVVDPKNAMRGTVCGVIVDAGVNVAGRTIEVDFSGSTGTLAAKPPGRPTSPLVAIPAHRYMVDADNRLMRDEMVLADDVEDFQVAYFFDRDDDGDPTEVGEVFGSATGAVYVANALNMDNEELRQVRFNFVTRARRPDPSFTGATFQATENRAAVAGTDGFRRRLYRAEVRLRNIGRRWREGA